MHVLLESGGRRAPAQGGWTLLSAVAHAGLMTAAVVATASVEPIEVVRTLPDTLVYVQTRPLEEQPVRRTGDWTSTSVDVPAVDVPRIPVPGPVDLSRSHIEPGIIGEIGDPVSIVARPAAAPSDGVFSEAAVDRAAAPRADNPRPLYPSQLRATGLEGNVVVRFVVDTTGAVERGSITVVEATHAAFADAVRAWLPRTRYLAAEVSGRRVRQLVQQRVEFQLHAPR